MDGAVAVRRVCKWAPRRKPDGLVTAKTLANRRFLDSSVGGSLWKRARHRLLSCPTSRRASAGELLFPTRLFHCWCVACRFGRYGRSRKWTPEAHFAADFLTKLYRQGLDFLADLLSTIMGDTLSTQGAGQEAKSPTTVKLLTGVGAGGVNGFWAAGFT